MHVTQYFVNMENNTPPNQSPTVTPVRAVQGGPAKRGRKATRNRVRRFCFTLNNYTKEEEDYLQAFPCTWLVMGKEVGESGTPHLQGEVIATEKNATILIQWLDFIR